MNTNLLKEVLACVCAERTLYPYYSDQYAVDLVRRLLTKREKIAIAELRKSQWSGLLDRPIFKKIIADCGSGFLDLSQLTMVEVPPAEPYVLTLGEWSESKYWRGDQTSRPGNNLVLQLNISRKWSGKFQALANETVNDFTGYGHPVSESRTATLAWSRMDVDFETDEVLIEEIQSDLIREVGELNRCAQVAKKDQCEHFSFCCLRYPTENTLDFCREFLEAFSKIWHEVMLAASIDFVFEELGCSHLYYHSFDTGNIMKNMRWSKPPRSLYSQLPKKFCFQKTGRVPQFLRREKLLRKKLKKLENGCWFHMAAH